jgi:hypothetical protein
MTGGGNPRRAVDVHAHVALRRRGRFASMDPHAHPDRSACKPVASFCGRGKRLGRFRKGDKKGIPLRVHLDAAVSLESFA